MIFSKKEKGGKVMSKKKEQVEKIEYLVNEKWRPSKEDEEFIKRFMQKNIDDVELDRETLASIGVYIDDVKEDDEYFKEAEVAIAAEIGQDVVDNFDRYTTEEKMIIIYASFSLHPMLFRDIGFEGYHDDETCTFLNKIFKKVDPDVTDPLEMAATADFLYEISYDWKVLVSKTQDD